MYKNSIGVIYSLAELLERGPDKLFDLGIDCVQIVHFNTDIAAVNFPVFLPKLLEQGYTGDLYIEREISGDRQIKDIKETVAYIKKFL
jgi:sugar phosphate isomerase/epimerase